MFSVGMGLVNGEEERIAWKTIESVMWFCGLFFVLVKIEMCIEW